MTQKEQTSEKRKAQLRESQRRRREMLSANDRHQVNLFLSKEAISLLDKACRTAGVERHDFVEQLILDSFTNNKFQ